MKKGSLLVVLFIMAVYIYIAQGHRSTKSVHASVMPEKYTY